MAAKSSVSISGTTNSCVAVMEGGEPVIIPNAEGGRTTPSVVAFTEDRRAHGRQRGEAAGSHVNARRAPICLHQAPDGHGLAQGDHRRAQSYTPQEISRDDPAQAQGRTRRRSSASRSPTRLSPSRRISRTRSVRPRRTRGSIAGLNVQRIINEPTGAALAYGLDNGQAQKIMVYDLGGGTFDVSILDISSGVIEVLATAGNNHLGGDDFDQCIVDYLVQEFKKENKIDLSRDAAAMQRIREAAEKAKIELSAMTQTSIELPYITVGKNGPLHMDIPLSRAKFNDLTYHLVQATREPVNQAINDSGVSIAQISKVLMVGGSSRIPAVQDLVQSITGTLPFKGINPDECVAMGACLQGGVLSGSVQGLLLLDVTPLSLGIETLGGVCTRVIERNTTLPIRKSQIFTTASSFQSSVDIHVLQGERPMASQNKELGRFQLTGIRRAPRRRAADRGHVRHRRQRHPDRLRASDQDTGTRPIHHHHRRQQNERG